MNELRRKVTTASPVQERFREVIWQKITERNFVSPYTVDFKMQTSYTEMLEITATPQAGIFFSPQQHIKKCTTPQQRNPNVPLFQFFQ